MIRTVPAGLSRKAMSAAISASISAMRGASDWNRRSPASVGATLRVVRVSRRMPSRASSRLIVWLSVDCDVPKLRRGLGEAPLLATARNHSKSFMSSRCIGHLSPAFMSQVDKSKRIIRS